MVNIFEFTDFRDYLKAYFEDRKKADSRFSHRWLAGRLDLYERNITSVTISINTEMYGAIRKKIDDFRQDLLALTYCVQPAQRVYQVNFQLFPVSKLIRMRG